jgi:hypothetical protein
LFLDEIVSPFLTALAGPAARMRMLAWGCSRLACSLASPGESKGAGRPGSLPRPRYTAVGAGVRGANGGANGAV